MSQENKNPGKKPEKSAAAVERQRFSERLVGSLKAAGVPVSPTRLAKMFNAHSSGSAVNPQAARKWLLGQSIPTQDKLQKLATLLGVSATWLRFGGGVPRSAVAADIIADVECLGLSDQALARKIIRVLVEHGRDVPRIMEATNG